MNEELNKKVSKAKKLRERPTFPFCYFKTPDFTESGEIFCEVARECKTEQEQTKYYLEAANTFLMRKDEYGEFCASECYRKLFEILEKVDIEKALEFYMFYSEILEKMKKYLNAGQGYTKIADHLALKDLNRAALVYPKAILTYKKDRASCSYHLKTCLQNYLKVQLELENLEGSLELLNQLEFKYSKLCEQILNIVIGKLDLGDDPLDLEESKLIMSLLNSSREDSIKVLQSFRENNYLPEIVSKVFDIAVKRLGPENDIC